MPTTKVIALFARIPAPLYKRIMKLKGQDVKLQGVVRRALELWAEEQEAVNGK